MSIKTLLKTWTVTICWLLVLPAAVYAVSVEKFADDVVKSFAEHIDLRRATVQLAPDSFVAAQSRRRLGLSQALYNIFAEALAKANVKMSLQEVGAEPLVLSGEYDITENKIIIHVRLRQMGREYSRDLAARNLVLKREDVAEALLEDTLDRAAEGLVRKLAAQAVLPGATRFQVALAVPAGENKPTIKLGSAFQQAIQTAVNRSRQFGTVALGKDVPTTWLRPEYAVGQTRVTLVLKLDKNAMTDTCVVQTTLDIEQIDRSLLQMYDELGVPVCAEVAAPESDDVKPGSDRAEMLLQVVTDNLFAGYNIRITRCKKGFSGRKITLRMKRFARSTGGGYTFVSSRLQADVTDRKGEQLGLLTTSARISRAAQKKDRGALVRKILDGKSTAELAAALLIYQR
ncbi:MAG: hypothetical protein CSA26_09740 [Desulfobacterales bacterium]|nr:MAG: hypothetical protein CSA26_09740 [Desulfobacterales bacterium]